jgi:16S rRNA pseudouridine516 synthase
MSSGKETLIDILREQGFGSKKECRRLVREGGVEVGRETPGATLWSVPEDPEENLDKQGLVLRAKGFTLPYRERLFLAFHKPADTECSRIPTYHRSVFSFFPAPYLERGLQSVGRLDADTTGLLLFTDSGALNHFLTSPKRHVAKVYRVETRHPIAPDQVERLSAGVELRSEDGPTLPARVLLLDERRCELTIAEGKYHQVKRMFAAVGNRVEKIHRIAIGSLRLEDTLAPGQWRHLEAGEWESLGFRGV